MHFDIRITIPPQERERLEQLIRDPPRACAQYSLGSLRVLRFINRAHHFEGEDVMTAWSGQADTAGEAVRMANRDANILAELGLTVLRVKVEAPAWEPTRFYRETHIKVIGEPDPRQPLALKLLGSVSLPGLDLYLTFRTRSNCNWQDHRQSLDYVVRGVVRSGRAILGVSSESVIYDSNPEHDRAWEEVSYE